VAVLPGNQVFDRIGTHAKLQQVDMIGHDDSLAIRG
jgi:hypothetical protein